MPAPSPDHYSVLGVLPEAEPVVITAAYRALAQRYHPDRWSGPPEVAHSRMSAINAAYAVLSDPESRDRYDKSRDKRSHSGYGQAEENDQSFEDALAETAERWTLACELYPDLEALRSRLKKTSASLALAFTSLLLEHRHFSQRAELAEALERTFLERYFTSNPKLIEFARRLISAGQKEPLRALNRLIDVVGADDDPQIIIRHIDQKFDLPTLWKQIESDNLKRERTRALVQRVRYSSEYEHARELALLLGYEVGEVGHGLFNPTEVVVSSPTGHNSRHPNKATFVTWAKNTLCR